MSSYRFGLKPLKEKAKVEVKLKSLFGLKPLKPIEEPKKPTVVLTPLKLILEHSIYYRTDVFIGSHQITPEGNYQWKIITADVYDSYHDAWATNITIKQPSTTKYHAYILVTLHDENYIDDSYMYIYFYYLPSKIEIYTDFYFPNARNLYFFYTLQTIDGQTFNCEFLNVMV